jgi:hypothetical protein
LKPTTNELYLVDSLRGTYPHVIENIKKWYDDANPVVKRTCQITTEWVVIDPHESKIPIPYQVDGNNCGVFLILYSYSILSKGSLPSINDWDGNFVYLFRYWIAHYIETNCSEWAETGKLYYDRFISCYRNAFSSSNALLTGPNTFSMTDSTNA